MLQCEPRNQINLEENTMPRYRMRVPGTYCDKGTHCYPKSKWYEKGRKEQIPTEETRVVTHSLTGKGLGTVTVTQRKYIVYMYCECYEKKRRVGEAWKTEWRTFVWK
jgi:hypothetical protein